MFAKMLRGRDKALSFPQAQYNDEFRDTRMIRQKVTCHQKHKCYIMLLVSLQRESEGKLKVLEKKCEKRLSVSEALSC